MLAISGFRIFYVPFLSQTECDTLKIRNCIFVVLYPECETWFLTLMEVETARVFEKGN